MKDMHLFNSRSYKKESKGNQIKDEVNGVWIKADYLGYEAAAEYAVSKLLKGTSVDHVDYEICYEVFGNNKMLCCKSFDFLEEGQDVITLHRLFRKCLGVDIAGECVKRDTKDAIRWVVEQTESLTGINGFGEYLSGIFALDAITLNEDRHFRNIAVLKGKDGFSLCPVFDNGAAFLSDTYSYPKGNTERVCLEKLMQSVEAKPFSDTFDEQLDAVEELYGTPVKFGCKDLIAECGDEILKYYDKETVDRIDFVFRETRRKYKYLFG